MRFYSVPKGARKSLRCSMLLAIKSICGRFWCLIIRRKNIPQCHLEAFLPGVTVFVDSRNVDLEEGKSLEVVHPHGRRGVGKSSRSSQIAVWIFEELFVVSCSSPEVSSIKRKFSHSYGRNVKLPPQQSLPIPKRLAAKSKKPPSSQCESGGSVGSSPAHSGSVAVDPAEGPTLIQTLIKITNYWYEMKSTKGMGK